MQKQQEANLELQGRLDAIMERLGVETYDQIETAIDKLIDEGVVLNVTPASALQREVDRLQGELDTATRGVRAATGEIERLRAERETQAQTILELQQQLEAARVTETPTGAKVEVKTVEPHAEEPEGQQPVETDLQPKIGDARLVGIPGEASELRHTGIVPDDAETVPPDDPRAKSWGVWVWVDSEKRGRTDPRHGTRKHGAQAAKSPKPNTENCRRHSSRFPPNPSRRNGGAVRLIPIKSSSRKDRGAVPGRRTPRRSRPRKPPKGAPLALVECDRGACPAGSHVFDGASACRTS